MQGSLKGVTATPIAVNTGVLLYRASEGNICVSKISEMLSGYYAVANVRIVPPSVYLLYTARVQCGTAIYP